MKQGLRTYSEAWELSGHGIVVGHGRHSQRRVRALGRMAWVVVVAMSVLSACADLPEVSTEALYEFDRTTETYARGLTHSGWGGVATGEMDLLLDVYEPQDAPSGRPAIVIIHGGGFTGGSRTDSQYIDVANYFASRGWVAVSIDYRVASDYGDVPESWQLVIDAQMALLEQEYAADGVLTPTEEADLVKKRNQGMAMYVAARDAKAAVRWLHANAERYQINTNYVTALGGSAGSSVSIMLGVSNPEDFRDELSVEEDPTLATTHLDQPSGVHTIIDHWGGGNLLNGLEMLDGQSRFEVTDAPISIVHGMYDDTVPYQSALDLQQAYGVTGVRCDLHPLDMPGHGLWNARVGEDERSLSEVAYDFIVDVQHLAVMPGR